MKKLILVIWLSLAFSVSAHATTWFVRADGGSRYDATFNNTGQCDGKGDVAYPGTGVNQHCAFNDFRWLYDIQAFQPMAWVIAGGDTVVVRGCNAAPTQSNPSNPNCRLGWDQNNGTFANNPWCYAAGNTNCFMPPVPAGTSGLHTQILGGCAYDNTPGPCTPINNFYPYGTTTETQLFAGFGLTWAFNVQSTGFIDVKGIEFTTHNGVCTKGVGSPAYPRACSTSPPDDYAATAVLTNNATHDVTFQDVYIHGFVHSAMQGPIGGAITMTRVFMGFNAFAGYDFDDGSGTPDAPGSSITANFVTMLFNGCYEQYPITNTYPALVCYDTNSAGFGDSWSGQGVGMNSQLSAFTCNYCVDNYNTKDAFIGPHINISNLVITHSVAIGNMGANWKWGGDNTQPNNTTFNDNLTVGGCFRMKEAITGAPSNYNQFLTGFCRAGGNSLANSVPLGSTWNFNNDTWITSQPIALLVSCPAGSATGSCTSTINLTNQIFLGYSDANNSFQPPAVIFYDPSVGGVIAVNTSHNLEFGMKAGTGTCPATTNGQLCIDPKLVNEPPQTSLPNEAALDVWNPFVTSPLNGFFPTASSPVLGAGLFVSGLTVDYYSAAFTNPPPMGAVELSGSAPTVANPTCTPPSGIYATTQSVTCSSVTPGSTTYCTIDGSTPTNLSPVCTSISVATTLVLKAISEASGFTNSSVVPFTYTINSGPARPLNFGGSITLGKGIF